LCCDEVVDDSTTVGDILKMCDALYKRLDAAEGVSLYRIWRVPILDEDLREVD
jgi:hypothetical protein